MQTGIIPSGSNYFPLSVFGQKGSEPLNPESDSPLIRYDFKTGEYVRLNPMPGRAFKFHRMQVNETEIWLPTNEGLFLYDKMAQTWNKIEPPLETRKFPPFSVSGYVRKGNEFRFLGYGQALRFRKKNSRVCAEGL